MNSVEYDHMAHAEEFHWWYRGLRAHLTAARRRHLPPEPVRLLDAGCGTGGNLRSLCGNDHTWGIDRAPEALAWCRRQGLSQTARAAVAALPFPDDFFDGVISCDVLYHRAVEDKVGALREMARVVRPGGLIFINVPAFEWLRSSHDDAIHTGTRFDKRTLRLLIREAGLSCREMYYWNALLFPAAATARLIRRGQARHASDLAGVHDGPLNLTLTGVLSVERLLLRLLPAPVGLSLFCVVQTSA